MITHLPDGIISFREDGAIAMSVARRLRLEPTLARERRYPAGEILIQCHGVAPKHVLVVGNVTEDPASLFRLIALAEGLRAARAAAIGLLAPWIAYGRQDRIGEQGEAPIGLAIGKILAQAYGRIVTLDAHSPAFMKSFRGKLDNVLPSPVPVQGWRADVVVAPDAGAIARAKQAARSLGVPMIAMTKQRAGARMVTKLPDADEGSFMGKRVLLVDDLADSGGTVLAAARALRERGASFIGVSVTHAVDAHALHAKVRDEISEWRVVFDHATGALENDALERLLAAWM